MSKNIVVCCDGTSNQLSKANTNVVKLVFTLVSSPAQVVYYHPGLGTMEPAGALTPLTKKITRTLGLAFGYGLDTDIRDAYVFIMKNYEEGDRLFLFGFSRGAYTARALASLLKMYGLIRRDNESLVPYAIRMMNAIAVADRLPVSLRRKRAVREIFDLADRFKESFSVACKPWFVGLWDTVSSVGWVTHPVKIPFAADNPDIEIGRHAIAIDERRAFFRTNLWRPKPGGGPKDLKQVWFSGSHGDVGGGYPEDQSGLAKIALEWMLVEARQHDLLVDPVRAAEVLPKMSNPEYAAPDPDACLHNSLIKWWRLAEFAPKKHFDEETKRTSWRMNLFRARTLPKNAAIHETAFMRCDPYTDTFPSTASKEPWVRLSDGEVHSVNNPTTRAKIDARSYWNDTGIRLEAGTCYRFLAHGYWHDASICCTPKGYESPNLVLRLAEGLRRAPHEDWFALMGTVDHDPAEQFVIGLGRTWTCRKSGTLTCFANDVPFAYANNSGSIELSLSVCPAAT